MKTFNQIREETLEEKLKSSDPTGKWIHDFVHSDNPKFAGKSKKKRIQMALGVVYAAKRNEEVEGVDEAAFWGNKELADKMGKAREGGKSTVRDLDSNGKVKTTTKTIPMGGKKKVKEEVEPLDEGKMDKMSLSHLWHRHAQHSYTADQGYGNGTGSMNLNHHAATAIENHVRKHHGNKVADDMVHHSDLHVAHAEYVGEKEAKEVESSAEKLRKKHGIKGDLYGIHEESQLKDSRD